MNEIKDVLYGDYRKALLFLNGVGLTDKNIHSSICGVSGALMAEPEMFKDPYIKKVIHGMIKKRINDAKIGVLAVHGNYSIIGGDPYALCQSMFGLPVTGLLKAGEIYNEYWANTGAQEVIACRAPMSAINNIRKCKVANSEDVRHWYQYIHTCTLLNAWDTCRAAENGADCDGDLFFLTDNPVMLRNLPKTRTIFCVQRNAPKAIPTEETQIASNLASFGDDIGKTTNRVTSMYDVQSLYEEDSVEYDTLEYRIMSGQLYQQNCIDKIKGIVCNPMPKIWFDYHANALPEDASDAEIIARDFRLRILADKKPYFMRYIYPTLMKQYNEYIKNANTKCLREFRMTVDELLATNPIGRTDEQKSFIEYYERKIPVGTHNCVMNRICRRFEGEFDGITSQWKDEPFDYRIMKADIDYQETHFNRIKRLYDDYAVALKEIASGKTKASKNELDSEFVDAQMNLSDFRRKCLEVCNNDEVLSNILLDVCYRRTGTKKFAWDVCDYQIIRNLASRHENAVYYPTQDEDGDIEFSGMRFSMVRHDIGGFEQECEDYERDSSEREEMGEGSD